MNYIIQDFTTAGSSLNQEGKPGENKCAAAMTILEKRIGFDKAEHQKGIVFDLF